MVKEKTTLVALLCVLPSDMHNTNASAEVFYNLREKLPMSLKNYISTEGAVSHSVFDYLQVSIAHYQLSCY